MNSQVDYYNILQVSPKADADVIQAAYRRLASRYHPDKNPSPEAGEKMMQLNAAYAVLSDPDKRRAYDMARASSPSWEEGVSSGYSKNRSAWWFLPLAAMVLLGTTRVQPRLVLWVGLILLLLWLFKFRQKKN
ncbi:MAG: J domain-containing protein [Dehalococcoidia bacterium]|nr:J domain-containing protein [Dehalococcoidia bacterium]MDZ4247336.1 J domain-containing protein [Dehalococcoidia bacterium]